MKTGENIVFLVDDDEDDCLITSNVLSEFAPNSSISCIYQGDELLRKMEGMKPEQYPSLIMLDLNMPGLNGFETLARLKSRAEWQKIPVIILTTSSATEDAHRSYQLGASLFLTKPSNYKDFLRAMKQASEYLPV